MEQQSTDLEKRYQEFITRAVETEKVWGLSQKDTMATSSSGEFEDTEVILFWSDEASAASCAEDDWATYKPEAIPLVDFLENWCVGMYGDQLLLGANWNPDLTGKESEPLDVALAVVQELKDRGKTIEFTQYDNQQEFEDQIVEALEGDE